MGSDSIMRLSGVRGVVIWMADDGETIDVAGRQVASGYAGVTESDAQARQVVVAVIGVYLRAMDVRGGKRSNR